MWSSPPPPGPLAALPLLISCLAAAAGTAPFDPPEVEAGRWVLVVRLENQPITPVTVRFLERALARADTQRAECLVIVLDTPGGLVDSTREAVKVILASPVPVVVFVAPSGARAASAGVFITLAAHVAAMAPGTSIGAAHPVPLGGLPAVVPPRGSPEDRGDDAAPPGDLPPAEVKAINDTVSWARALAAVRGRDAGWAERAVRESLSVPADEAVAAGVVDLIAPDLPGLLAAIDGREVAVSTGSRTLHTAAATAVEEPMWWGEQILAALANPNLALLLLVLGFYGVLFELYTPGWGVAGTLGVVCLAASFFSLAVLPVRVAGLVLVAVGLAMVVAEGFATSYGSLALGGAGCLVLGGLMLVESPAGFVGVSLTVLLPLALTAAVIAGLLVAGIVRAHRRRAVTGVEAAVGGLAIAEADFHPAAAGHAGTVWMHGERWRATSEAPVSKAARLQIAGRDGLTLLVRPAPADSSDPPDTPPEKSS